MSYHGENSVREKVTGKKWIYLDRNTLHRQYASSQKGRVASKYGVVIFMGWVISYANEWEEYSNYFGEGANISRN